MSDLAADPRRGDLAKLRRVKAALEMVKSILDDSDLSPLVVKDVEALLVNLDRAYGCAVNALRAVGDPPPYKSE